MEKVLVGGVDQDDEHRDGNNVLDRVVQRVEVPWGGAAAAERFPDVFLFHRPADVHGEYDTPERERHRPTARREKKRVLAS